jgi:hypothetical protein
MRLRGLREPSSMPGQLIADADGEGSNAQLRHRRTTVLARTSEVLRMTSFLRPAPVYLFVALWIVLTAAVARADLGDCGQPRTSEIGSHGFVVDLTHAM